MDRVDFLGFVLLTRDTCRLDRYSTRHSKQSLEQAARTYGFFRSLNLTGAPIHGLVDCIAVNVFR
jgi:hypothetical protein